MQKRIILIGIIILSIVGLGLTITYIQGNSNSEGLGSLTPPNRENEDTTLPDNSEDMTNPPDNGNMDSMPNNFNRENSSNLSIMYIIIISLLCSVLSISLTYLLISIKNPKFYQNKDKLIIFILSNILLIATLTIIITSVLNKTSINTDNPVNEEETVRDEVNLDESNVASENNINLDNEVTDITITSGGTYTFTGSFTHSIIVDAGVDEVELVLNGVDISNDTTGAIIGVSAGSITINIARDTENFLSDGGNSEYDGCIFSNAELIFTGNGILNVNGNQNEGEGIATEAKDITINSGTIVIISNDDGINAGGDGATITINGGTIYVDASGDGIDSNQDAIINGGTVFVMGSDIGGDSGIDTDAGYTINGGLVVALGSDMIETPNDNSQNTLAFTLSESIAAGELVTLMHDDEVIVSFQATKSFKTIIISSENITSGSYSLYQGGTNTGTLKYGLYSGGEYSLGSIITINNETNFTVSKSVNIFGSTR